MLGQPKLLPHRAGCSDILHSFTNRFVIIRHCLTLPCHCIARRPCMATAAPAVPRRSITRGVTEFLAHCTTSTEPHLKPAPLATRCHSQAHARLAAPIEVASMLYPLSSRQIYRTSGTEVGPVTARCHPHARRRSRHQCARAAAAAATPTTDLDLSSDHPARARRRRRNAGAGLGGRIRAVLTALPGPFSAAAARDDLSESAM